MDLPHVKNQEEDQDYTEELDLIYIYNSMHVLHNHRFLLITRVFYLFGLVPTLKLGSLVGPIGLSLIYLTAFRLSSKPLGIPITNIRARAMMEFLLFVISLTLHKFMEFKQSIISSTLHRFDQYLLKRKLLEKSLNHQTKGLMARKHSIRDNF